MGFNFRVYPGKYHDKFLQKKKKKEMQKAGFLGHHEPISPSIGKNRLFLKFLLLPLLFFF